MLRDLEAVAVIVTTCATVLGFLIRRHRALRRSPDLEHMHKLEQENEEMDSILKRMKGDK